MKMLQIMVALLMLSGTGLLAVTNIPEWKAEAALIMNKGLRLGWIEDEAERDNRRAVLKAEFEQLNNRQDVTSVYSFNGDQDAIGLYNGLLWMLGMVEAEAQEEEEEKEQTRWEFDPQG